ncbi:surface carbohydrate biosynthesis protein [Desulfofustis limnaeus]|uniref:surface carbohydrate biosynthesis protein n=1 Tax=Desulfofustis limnaeus TaxID=2740163 RepID=UPI0024DF909A|nr:surface carbohydrate biosynthesis protein [Desulfofustis limnaeus]
MTDTSTSLRLIPPLHWLIIPIETKVREFDAKLLLSCAAAEAGYGVVLGHQHTIQRTWRKMPCSIVFDKSVVKSNEKRFAAYKRLGNGVFAWCEEGLLLADEQDYANRKLYQPTLRQLDLFCSWGANQTRVVLNKIPEIKDRLHNVGNPRMDLLRPEVRDYFAEEAEAIKKVFGPFLLINTNFAAYNNIRGSETSLEIQKRSGKIRSSEGERLFREFVQFKERMFHAFISLVEALAKAFPAYTIVVRPHPAEDHEVWRKTVSSWSNVRIVHEGNVVNWILAAEVTIQNGCTTGIESFLLDRPTISYQPFAAKIYEDYLPDVLGMAVKSEKDLIELVRSICSGTHVADEQEQVRKRELARHFIENIDGDLCIDRIVTLLPLLRKKEDVIAGNIFVQTARQVRNWQTTWRYFARSVKDRLIDGQSMTLKKAGRKSLASVQEKVVKQVFPGLALDEVNAAVRRFQLVMQRFDNVQVLPYEKNCFVIAPWRYGGDD